MDILNPPTVWINGICYRKNEESSNEANFDGEWLFGCFLLGPKMAL